jgi:hypothetical protein
MTDFLKDCYFNGFCKGRKNFVPTTVADPGWFIPDPDPTIAPSRIPDPGGKKAPDPGSYCT